MNPLAQLQDIHLPPDVGQWPFAYGWWFLLALICLAIAFGVWFSRRINHKLRPKREALIHLRQIETDDANAVSQCNAILKRAVMSYFPADQTAHLYGERWQVFLCQQIPSNHQQQFNHGFQHIATSLYQPLSDTDSKAAIDATALWLKTALPPKRERSTTNV